VHKGSVSIGHEKIPCWQEQLTVTLVGPASHDVMTLSLPRQTWLPVHAPPADTTAGGGHDETGQ
jgi:hypothetical protein